MASGADGTRPALSTVRPFEVSFLGAGRCSTLCDTRERQLIGRGVLVTQAAEPPAAGGVALALLAALTAARGRAG